MPPARLGDFLRRLVTLLARYDLAAATYYGHFGEGCVHCRINFDFFTTEGIARFRAAMVEIGDLVAEFGGSLRVSMATVSPVRSYCPRCSALNLSARFANSSRPSTPTIG